MCKNNQSKEDSDKSSNGQANVKTNAEPKAKRKKLNYYLLVSMLVLSCLLLIKPSYLYAKAVIAQLLLNQAWHESKQQGGKHLPWQWSDSYPVAKLTYPQGNMSWIILSGMTGRAMAFAPSWLEDSAKPNQYGNTVISAHNDSHFQLLENSQLGETFLMEDIQGQVLKYRIVSIDVVPEDDASAYQFQDETMITLITCYPFTVTHSPKTQRLVIQAVNVSA